MVTMRLEWIPSASRLFQNGYCKKYYGEVVGGDFHFVVENQISLNEEFCL
jgi:hypothetical protein